MTKKYASAIEGVGCWFTTKKQGEALSFLASLQPDFHQGGTLKGDTGFGVEQSFRLYLPYNQVTEALVAGDIFSHQTDYYRILRIETIYYSGKPLYRQGTALSMGVEKHEL